MSGIGSNTYKPGVLQGIVITPSENTPVEIRYTGSALDLMKVAVFLGLEPTDSPENVNPDSPVIELRDNRGGYATLQPAERASDLLQTVAAIAKEEGMDFPRFL